MKPRALHCLALYGVWSSVAACPFSADDPLLRLRPLADQTIVRINTNGPPGCTNMGTGFFINAAGEVLTAGHIFPEKCTDENTSINVRLGHDASATDSDPIEAHVVARSSLDVVLLRLEKQPDKKYQFLKVAAVPGNESTFKNRCVLIASHYETQFDTYSTFAEIASVAVIGSNGWALSGEGFNPTRSGSPVILDDGSVTAVFLSRPADPTNRNTIIQSRANILPIARIPTSELHISQIAARNGTLQPFPSQPLDSQSAHASAVNSSFGISITVNGYQTNPALPVYLVAKKDGGLKPVGSLLEAGATALATGSDIVREVVETRQFNASPGFRFDASTLKIITAALNPQKTPLPTSPCDTPEAAGCYILGPNGDILELRFKLYPGIDGRRAWVDGEVHLVQRPI
ncbi:S1 family peptidase [Noviherbaspirillum suwonense]|uniref:Trypsin-like peptidase domain-containing protein n=1 Tax=Noviherbaspirillum suwonense TaxID=1224511 RepID=A0ABY1QVM5_9BURK|nr:serine protease [Noviherbaspirillum suwonense]SMP82114.1 Trypsin-like peptidase domain-containing protein [Noviherbaspirillum suwonense]